MNSLRGTDSAALNATVRLLYSLQSQGLRRSAAELLARVRAKSDSTHRSQAGPKLPLLERCTWLENIPGLRRHDMHIDRDRLAEFMQSARYPRFYYRGDRRIRYAVWHMVGFQLCNLKPSDVVIDVGAQAGIWGRLARRLAGCRVIDVDLCYPSGIRGDRIGADAGNIPLPDESASHIVCFCAFNCFAGSADVTMIRSAPRLLRPGGKLVIVPFCIGDQYVNLFDPNLCGDAAICDPGATAVPWPGWGNPFGRWYDEQAFQKRILDHLPGFSAAIYHVHHNIPEMIPSGSFHTAVFQKP